MMQRTRVKICGIKTIETFKAAVSLGVDAIGLMFYKKSKRVISLDIAKQMAAVSPAFVNLVGVFVNPSVDEVNEVLEAIPLTLLQFHGDEPPAFCEQFQRPFIKAIRPKENSDVRHAENVYKSAQGLLLDSGSAGSYGGTGKTFDWNMIPSDGSKPIILAGGLNQNNVIDAILNVQPYAVDVSGSVEDMNGNKRKEKMEAFIRAVKKADSCD